MSANDRQVGGNHYKTGGEEHWDRAHRLGLDYFQANITKYVERAWLKNGTEDLKKARHYLDKYIELQGGEQTGPVITGLVFKGKTYDLFEAQALLASMESAEPTKPPGGAMSPSVDFVQTHSDDVWQCEGYYGDGTQLYRHRVDRKLIRCQALSIAYELHAAQASQEAQMRAALDWRSSLVLADAGV